MSLRVLLADDQALVRLGIRAVFQGLDDISVCGEATNGIDAIRKAYELAPDIIVADPWLSGANGVILTKRILERNPNQKVLIFADLAPDAMIYQLLSAGIKGLVLKTDPSADLIEATKALWQDRLYFSRSVTTAIVGNYLCADLPSFEYTPTFHRLTLREQEVAQLLAEGKASKEVGDILGISYRTANTHRSNLMRKLSVHNCAALTFYAATHLIIKDPRFTVPANIVEFPRSAPQTGPKWREERRGSVSALATTSDSSVVSRASMRA
jgi:DNA-binding NarL/FixJ family response regulator